MKKAIGHLRGNAVAYLALFVALGGTSYAAIAIPANSVGTSQLRNGAVTQKKLGRGAVGVAQLDKRSVAGTIVFWAQVAQDGSVIRSSEPASTLNWSDGNGTLVFPGRFSNDCFALASVFSLAAGDVSVHSSASLGGQERLNVLMIPTGSLLPGPLPVRVAEVCPG